MRLIRTDRFAHDYARLPARVQKQTDRKVRCLARNITHPSLRVKRVQKYRHVYEGSINMDYRFLFLVTEDAYVLLRIGRHDMLERL
ncbi:MAG: hypothetical protein ACE5O2_07735 [Armatimonadota bacterium]